MMPLFERTGRRAVRLISPETGLDDRSARPLYRGLRVVLQLLAQRGEAGGRVFLRALL